LGRCPVYDAAEVQASAAVCGGEVGGEVGSTVGPHRGQLSLKLVRGEVGSARGIRGGEVRCARGGGGEVVCALWASPSLLNLAS
jgi:hypothetical protein